MIRKLLLIAAIVQAACGRAWAVNAQAGTSGTQFLKIGAGSRAGAMADAYTALGDDVYALYYNPAAATLIREPQLGAAHTSYFQGASYEVGDFAYPFGRENSYSRHVLGLGIYNLSISDIERRSTTESAAPIGTFGAGDYAYALTYAYRFDKTLGLGATGKMIYQTIDTYSSTAFAADLGAHYTPRPDAARPLSFAAVVKNFGTRPSFAGNSSDPLPVGMTLGAGWRIVPERFKAELDVTKYRDTDPFAAFGGEYTHPFGEDMSGDLRFGYSSQRRESGGLNGVTLGVGINFHRACFDFAWIPYGDLGNTFRYSLLIRFAGKAPGRR